MSAFIVLLICLFAGIGLRKLRSGGGAAIGMALNTVVIYVSLPALAVTQIHRMTMSSDVLLAAALPWLQFMIAWGISAALGLYMGWSRATIGMMVLTTGLGNTSFLGFPLIEAVVGKEGLPTAIVNDQLGSFFVVSTLGIIVAGIYSPEATSAHSFLRRIIVFPPFLATIFALATRWFHPPEDLMVALDRIGMTLTPLALMSVGSRMEFRMNLLKAYRGKVATGLFVKMFAMPAIIVLIIAMITSARDVEQKVMVLEAAMPSMITGYLIGAEHKLDANLGILVVTCGIALAMISIPLWAWALSFVGY